ncbi:hypothetical protein GEMRC1_009417 [Eukaryota sp. GEM-RC1]
MRQSLFLIVIFLSVLASCTKLTLYQFPHCPFCSRVRNFMKEQNVEFETVNVPMSRSDPIRLYIKEQSGVTTVPVLKVVHDDEREVWIGDSANIIRHLEVGVL